MSLTEWFAKRERKDVSIEEAEKIVSSQVSDNLSKLWKQCYSCHCTLPIEELKENQFVCPKCDYHFKVGSRTRIRTLIDEGTFEEIDQNLAPQDPLKFQDTEPYPERQKKAKEKTTLNDAIVCGYGLLDSMQVVVAFMDFAYMGGSMGSIVGEKVTRAAELAYQKRCPFITVCSTGGARMQEGILSLMQMAKTSSAIAKLDEAKILYISVLAEPTFGGVTASFGMLGDIIIAEKDARIGFAGRRVIEQTIRQKLPADFQTANYLLKYGQVDMVVRRLELKQALAELMYLHKLNSTNKIFEQVC